MEKIGMKRNTKFPGIEVKLGENQFSRHSHIHQVWSLSYVLQGKTVVSLGTWKSKLAKDQFISIPPGIPHLCSPESDNPFSFIVLYAPAEYPDIHAPEFSQPRIGKIQPALLFELADRFIQANDRIELEKCVQKMRKALGKHSSFLEDEWGQNLLEKKKVFIRAPHAGSRFQLYRYSRKLFGIGQKKISTIDKMELAKKLLAEDIDLIDIAFECGFYDQSHFTRVFKSYTGLTPSQYMNK